MSLIFISGVLGDIIDFLLGGALSQAKEDDSLRQSLASKDCQLILAAKSQDLENSLTDPSADLSYAASEKPFSLNHLLQHELISESNGVHIVGWYHEKDPANPQNWSLARKTLVSLQICLYTFTVYMGGAIFASSEPGMMQEFGVGHISAKWAFALYLVGYGVGPLLFSPISEVPKIGRNPPYIITMAIFVVLCVPTAVVTNYPGLLVLRFLQGFFGSPCLATGGATLQDMFALPKLPYAMTFWAWSMTCGPALAPIISGYSVSAEGWRWSLWEILWAAGPVFMIMLIFLPETNSQTILCRRAKRLRKALATDSLMSHGEMMQRSMHWKHMAWEALVKPAELVCMDPVILYADVYSSLCYAIFYSFFESFPFVYSDIYGFSPGEQGLAFLSVTVGTLVAGIWYAAWNFHCVEPKLREGKGFSPEYRLKLSLYSTVLMPVGLFVFAWTSRAGTHWFASLVGVALNTTGLIVTYQCFFMYLPLAYPEYAASLLAGNDFWRSGLAGAAVLFSRPLFSNLGIGKGVSLLGALMGGLLPGIWILYLYGDKLRARSRFARN